MAGRKPTPTALKLIRGNPGKRPINKREPKPERGIPTMPSHLTPRAKAAWKSIAPELERMGVLTVADGKALELLCLAYAEYRDARDVIEKEGVTYESHTQNGKIVRARPEVAIASDAWRRIRAMLTEFGLTPSSRSRIAVNPQERPKNAWQELTG